MTTWTLVEQLAEATIGGTFNFYREGEGAGLRRWRLRAYLDSRVEAPFLLVGEAAGYRRTGHGRAEPTATIVHDVLEELGFAESVLLWNLVPTHPHRPGRPDSNRPPTRAEIAAGRPFLEELARGRKVVPVGRLAQEPLGGPYVRHPSHGGAGAFRDGLGAAFRS